MRKSALIMIVLALLLGGGAVYVAQQILKNQASAPVAEVEPRKPLTTVVVAKRPLTFGDAINSDAVEEIEWPEGSVPPGSFRTVAELLGEESERAVLKPIEKSEPILAGKVAGLGERATLSALIPESKRAVTIRVNDVVGVAGFVLPGDRVDVLLTRDLEGVAGDGARQARTSVVLQNLKVLGIDQEANEDEDAPKVVRAVTLEVEPDEAQRLTLAQQVGTLTLTLRSVVDREPARTRPINVSDLEPGHGPSTPVEVAAPASAPAPVYAPAPRRSRITVYRGLDASNEKPRLTETRPARPAPQASPRPAPTPLVPAPQGASTADDDLMVEAPDGKTPSEPTTGVPISRLPE